MLSFVHACCASASFWLLGALLAETKHVNLSAITSHISLYKIALHYA